jgi:hypothetical protein
MRRFVSTMLISGLTLALASCASVPSQDQLTAGIDKTQLAQTTTTKRSAADPVCVDFYNNVGAFQQKAQSTGGTKRFLTSLGLGIASAVAVGQVVPSNISSQTGRLAAYSAAGTTAALGQRAALRKLNSSDRADAKVIAVAEEIGCPVSVRP